MKYRKLGASDLEVSEISLGSWLTYGVGVERDSAAACVDRAFDLGINFIDTANVYGRGAAETFLGEVLAGGRATPTCSRPRSISRWAPSDRGLSRAQIAQAVRRLAEAAAGRPRRSLPVPSLRRGHAARRDDAGADRGRAPGQGALHRLQRMVAGADRGGARHCRRRSASSPASRNIRCCGAGPEKKVIPLCAANGISQIVWSPLAQGVLTGKYAAGRHAASRLARRQRDAWAIHAVAGCAPACSRPCRS